MQQQKEESICKFCGKQITEADLLDSNMTMLQTSDCFHQVHIDCLREVTIAKLSQNENVNCPKCSNQVFQHELKEYLNEEQIKTIENN